MTQLEFLCQALPELLARIDPATQPAWGKLNLQQMVEHLGDSVRIANGRDPKTCVTPAERLPDMRRFLLSEKPFRENTVNIQMPVDPEPCRLPSPEAAIAALRGELDAFVTAFQDDSSRTITNPFFGDLNFKEWTQLLTKHCLHHLRQFGVVPAASTADFGT